MTQVRHGLNIMCSPCKQYIIKEKGMWKLLDAKRGERHKGQDFLLFTDDDSHLVLKEAIPESTYFRLHI